MHKTQESCNLCRIDDVNFVSSIPRTMLRTLFRALRTPPAAHDAMSVTELHKTVVALRTRVEELERTEARRSAEHATMVDQLDRLYKRVSARIARANGKAEPPEETVLDLRNRLGR